VKPVPVAFHLGPLEVHTYGIGLAITFYVAYRYFERRLANRGYPTDWVSTMFLWVIGAAIVGARVMHVLSNEGYYAQHPGQIPAIWQGGLSSFGGLLLAVPAALIVAHRRCPQLGVLRGLDVVAPVLMAAWAMGRLLGPQLMVAGGGHVTHQWFGMEYAGQVGRRVPVPIVQAMEDALVYVVLILVERRLDRWPSGSPRAGYPAGALTAIMMVLWGIERATDEHLLLGDSSNLGSTLVQYAGTALVIGGLVLGVVTLRRWRAWLSEEAQATTGAEPEPAPA
jgi:phosphatidylglycerol:prolipoprotein diacylglycerol transferase